MIFNVTDGGGGTGATLTVTAPAGATVTVSKDGKTLTRVAGTDGIAVFRGLQSGTWTVRSTCGTQTTSKDVDIVADYETSITTLLYNHGDECTYVTGGWDGCAWVHDWTSKGTLTKNEGSITLKASASSIAAYPVNKINLKSYRKLCINILQNDAQNTGRFYIGLANAMGTTTSQNYIARLDIGGAIGRQELDIPASIGDCFIYIGLFAVKDVTYTIAFDKVWIE